MSSAPSVPVLPFAELLDELRRHGFVIGLDQHLRMQQLLDHLAGECPPERLKTHLAPIFATSREEQERFHRIFDRLYPVFAEVEREEQRRHSGQVAESLVPSQPSIRPDRRLWIVGGLVVLVLLFLGLWRWLGPGHEGPQPISPVTVAPNPIPLPTPGGDSLAPLDSIPAELPPPSLDTLPPPPAIVPNQGFFERHHTATRVSLIALAIAAFLLNEWRLYQRRRLVVSRERRQKPPFTWPVRLESPANPFAQSADLPNAARLLRQREAGDVARLSVEETVTATIAALGFPTFRYRTDTRAPDYLLLIERSAHRDHAARLYQALGRALEREGVHVTRYLHDGDPRVCYSENGEQRELLVDLRRRFPDYRVLLFSKGEKLVDQVTGRLHSWTTQFLSWSDRALLTPESPAAWGLREVALAQHFVVLPATTAGLMGVVGHFRGPARPDPGRWRALDQDPVAPRLDDGDPLPSLQSYLGPRVYRWLCACAVYPELHWDLTLHFGTLSILGPGLISEENLLRLLRLPWFRQGAIPDEIRARLIDELTEAEERAVREAIVELLERNPAPGDSVSANRYELELVVQRLALHRRDPKQRRAAMRDLAGFPRRELVQDFAMLKLIEETPSSRLQVLLPRRLRRVFYRDGVPAFGVRTGMRMGVLAGIIGAGLLLTRGGEREQWSENVLLTSFSSDAEQMIVGEQVRLTPMRLYSVGSPVWGGWQGDLLEWGVDHPEVLSVDQGMVTAVGVGKARVTISSGGNRAKFDIEVSNGRFTFDRDSLQLSPGDVRALRLVVPSLDRRELSAFSTGLMQWTIDDSTVLRIGSRGVIEALAPGRTKVAVKGLGQAASMLVLVDQGSGREAETLPTVAQEATDSGGGGVATDPAITATPDNHVIDIDQRPAVELAVREYARAMEDGDLGAMLAVFPGMPREMRQGYDQFFASKQRFSTDRWRYLDFVVRGDSAVASLGGQTSLLDRNQRAYSSEDFPRSIHLIRSGGGWRIVAIDPYKAPAGLPPAGDSLPGMASGLNVRLLDLFRLDSLRRAASGGSRPARTEYFRSFDSLLLRPTQDLIRGRLLALPSRPEAGADYVRSYNLLKAHLITTGFPLKSSPDFLAPVLTQVWSEAAHPSGYLSRLVQTQFGYYAAELPRDNSLARGVADSLAIQRARALLQQFHGGEQVYTIMLAEAAQSGAQPFDFARRFPNAGQVLVVPHVVPAAFTRQGWAYMHETALKHSARYFQGEEWVLGAEQLDERARSVVLNSIRSRYRRDYAEHWRQVLAQARIAPYANLADASRKLRILAGNPSPLLQLINVVSLNTVVDSGLANTVFQPALVVSPADSTRLSGPQTVPYLKAMAALGAALDALIAAEPQARKGPAEEAKAQVAAARNAAQSLQLGFAVAAGGVGPDISRLLTTGFASIDPMLVQIGTAVADRAQPPQVASISLGTGVNSLAVGETASLVAKALDAKGKALADRALVWRSRNPLVATVSADGKVTGLAAGFAEIVVEVDGLTASQRVTVLSLGQDSTGRSPSGDSTRSGMPRTVSPQALTAYSRALLFEDLDSLQKASDSYREALRIFPEYTEASEGLTRVVVRQRLNDWTKHLEGRNLAGLLQLYPEMPERDQQAWKRLLENPSVTRLSVTPQGVKVELTGDGAATVRYALVYTVDSRPGGRKVSVSRYLTTFALVRGAWQVTSMRGVQ